jgi:hypothetical protein
MYYLICIKNHVHYPEARFPDKATLKRYARKFSTAKNWLLGGGEWLIFTNYWNDKREVYCTLDQLYE